MIFIVDLFFLLFQVCALHASEVFWWTALPKVIFLKSNGCIYSPIWVTVIEMHVTLQTKNQHPFCTCSWKIWKSQAISHVTNIPAWLYSNHGKCLLPGILGVWNPICYISQFIAKNMSYMISCGKHIAKSSDRSKCSKMRVRWGIWQLQQESVRKVFWKRTCPSAKHMR